MPDKNQLDSGGASWEAWGNHVLTTLEKLENKVDKLEEKISEQRENTVVEIATLKAKAGVWGTIAGVIASFITSLIVGLLVYNLTHSTVEKKVPTVHQTPPAASLYFPTREDPLDGIRKGVV
jgi:tetrahydromethanopterin S-methyltransferase subunit B